LHDGAELQTVDMDPPNKKNEYVYALGQAGTAAHFPKDPTQVVLGAPGIFSWRGMYHFPSLIPHRLTIQQTPLLFNLDKPPWNEVLEKRKSVH
jgi:hypothetical protein